MLLQASVLQASVLIELPEDKAGRSVRFPVAPVNSLMIRYTASETMVPPAMRMHLFGKLKHLEELLEFSRMSQYDLSDSNVRVPVVSNLLTLCPRI